MKGQVSDMSHKNKDDKNRWRNKTVAFRVSPEEWAEIEKSVKLCGYQTKQDYILDSLLSRSVKAVGNPLMLVTFKKELRQIVGILEQSESSDENDEMLLTSTKRMLEILEAFAKEGDI
jgi:uncharacterized protein (DUF1778 family)